MEACAVFGGGPIRGPQERLAAVMGNRGGEREPHLVVGEGPGRMTGLVPRRPCSVSNGSSDIASASCRMAGRQRVQEARDRPVERAVRHHRGHHRAHSGVGVGLADGFQTFRGRSGKLEAQVIGPGASLADHLHRADEGGEVLVLERPASGDPGRGVEQQLQGPAIADALGEIVVAVGMRVDEARHEQSAGCVERGRVGGGGHPRRADLAHGVARDQDVGGFGRVTLDVE